MAKSVARLGAVGVSASDSSYNDVSNMVRGTYTRNRPSIDNTDYDSGADDEFEKQQRNGQLSWEMFRNEANAGQAMLFTADNSDSLYWFRWRGVAGSGFIEYRQQGNITRLVESGEKRGMVMFSVEVQLSGAITSATQ